MHTKFLGVAMLALPLAGGAAPPDFEREANCGNPPDAPQWYHRLLSSKKVEAYEVYERCLASNREIERRNIERQTAELKNIVFQAHSGCRNAIRRIAAQPATLSFDYAQPFSYSSGLNGSGVDITDGGYSVQVTGTDVQGKFAVKCYMDKAFRISTLR